MTFAALFLRSGFDRDTLSHELRIDASILDRWLSGSASPPEYVMRAVSLAAGFADPWGSTLPQQDIRSSEPKGADRPTLVSLFSGAGGLDLGLENAGFKTLLANEIEAHACETLKANKMLATMDIAEFNVWFDNTVAQQRCYRKVALQELAAIRERLAPSLTANERPLTAAAIVQGDVRGLSAANVREITSTKPGEISLIAGGAPCQPFSRAGKQETVDCDDGRLFLEFVRLVDELRPRWFVFENVKGLVQHRTEALYATCAHCHATHPVSFALRSSTAAVDGVIDTCAACRTTSVVRPLWEKRRGGSLDVIEAEFSRLGYDCSSKVLNARDFGVPQDRERLFIVGSRDSERFEWPVPTHGVTGEAQSLFDRSQLSPYRSVRDALYDGGHWRYGELPRDAVLWVKNVVRPHDEPVTWTLDRFAPTVGAHQAAKLAIAPFGVPTAQLARQQWHTLGRRQGDTLPVFVEHEYLTDRELLILQTFPEHWYLHGTRMERAFQIGNAVPPALAAAVGSSLIAAMAGKRAAPSLALSV